jgi:hypothetical protein
MTRTGICPTCGKRARFLQRTCGDPKCKAEDLRGRLPHHLEPWLALMVGLIGGLLMGDVVGYTIGAGWWGVP